MQAEGQAGGEVDHATGVGFAHVGEVDDHRHTVAEGLADDPRLVVGGGVDGDDAAKIRSGHRLRSLGLLIGVVVGLLIRLFGRRVLIVIGDLGLIAALKSVLDGLGVTEEVRHLAQRAHRVLLLRPVPEQAGHADGIGV